MRKGQSLTLARVAGIPHAHPMHRPCTSHARRLCKTACLTVRTQPSGRV